MRPFKILLLVLALSAFGKGYGQALLVLPGDTFTSTTALVNNTDSHSQFGTFVNNTSAGDSIYWRLVSATMNSNWSMFFCDPNNCYYFTPTELNYAPHRFLADSGNSISVHFGTTPYCVADSGELVIVAWVANDSAASSKTLTYFGSYTGACVSAVQNVTSPQLSVYPNPVISALTIDGLTGLRNVKLTVYDVLGNVAFSKYEEQPATTTFSTSNLQAGVYFVTIDSDGSRLLTKRIQKLD